MSPPSAAGKSPSSDRPLRVAVIGAGRLGGFHARIYREHPDAELCGVVDVDGARGSELASELGCPAFESPRELPDDLDAVSVAVPTVAHAEIALPFLRRGLACLIEKPLAASLQEANALVEAAREAGATLAVGHVERFQPGLRRVRELGLKPRFIECHRLAPFSFRSTDIGVVHDLMIHDLDLILYLMDSEVVSLDAAGGALLTDREDLASVRLVFADGGRANVTASRTSLSAMRRFRMFSSESYVSLDFHKNYGVMVRKGPRWEEGRQLLAAAEPGAVVEEAAELQDDMLEVLELELEGEQRPLQAELDSFLRSVRAGTEPEECGEDGCRALELAERIAAEIQSQSW